MNKQVYKEKLLKYSKDDIIDGLLLYANIEPYNIERLLFHLQQRQMVKDGKEFDKVTKESVDALKAYENWQLEIGVKYGKFNLSLLPEEELQKGKQLAERWQKAEEKYSEMLDKTII